MCRNFGRSGRHSRAGSPRPPLKRRACDRVLCRPDQIRIADAAPQIVHLQVPAPQDLPGTSVTHRARYTRRLVRVIRHNFVNCAICFHDRPGNIVAGLSSCTHALPQAAPNSSRSPARDSISLHNRRDNVAACAAVVPLQQSRLLLACQRPPPCQASLLAARQLLQHTQLGAAASGIVLLLVVTYSRKTLHLHPPRAQSLPCWCEALPALLLGRCPVGARHCLLRCSVDGTARSHNIVRRCICAPAITGRLVRMRAVAGGPALGCMSTSMLSCLSPGCASSCGLHSHGKAPLQNTRPELTVTRSPQDSRGAGALL